MKKKSIAFAISVIVILVFVYMAARDLSNLNISSTYDLEDNEVLETTHVIASISGFEETVSLPHTFKDLTPGTIVSISFMYDYKPHNTLYVQSLYTPFTLLVNDEKIFHYGDTPPYNNINHDNSFYLPMTEIIILPTYEQAQNEVVINYIVQEGVEDLTVEPFMLGNYDSVIKSLVTSQGITSATSIILIVVGVVIFLLSIFTVIFGKKLTIFTCMSLFLLCIGIWSLGEGPLSMLYLGEYWLLYFVSLVAFSLYPLPLGHFYIYTLGTKEAPQMRRTLHHLLLILAIVIAIVYIGGGSFPTVVKTIQIGTYVTTVLFFIFASKRALKPQNIGTFTVHFFVFFLILLIFSTVEFININHRFGTIILNYTQVGTLIYSLTVAVIGMFFTYENIKEAEQSREMEYSIKMANYQLTEQKKGLQTMHDNATEIRRQRHDLRHQLLTIRTLIEENEIDLLKNHINTFIKNIPEPQGQYCENLAINSIVTYYSSLCKTNDIALTSHLSIPASENQELNSDLCVIFGNMLENAIEACNRMKTGEKHIKINSRMHHDTLTIAMDNSFNGIFNTTKGNVLSSKRDSVGIGLSSIKQIAQRHNGSANFKPEGNVFLSSIYLKIKE